MSSLTQWRGRSEIDRFRGDIDRLFDDFLNWRPPSRSSVRGDWVPAIDLSETDEEIVVHAEVPGIEEENIDISLNGRVIKIKGDRKQ